MNRRAIAIVCIFGMAMFLVGCSGQQQVGTTAAKVKSLLDDSEYVPDISTFLQIGEAYALAISNDGSKVFFKSNMSGTYQVYFLTENGWPYQLTTFDHGIDFFNLSHNARMAVVGASVGGSEQAQLYLMDTETGQLVQLTDYKDIRFGGVQWGHDDKTIVYYSNEENGRDMFIYQMDIATGEHRKVFGDTLGVRGRNFVNDVSPDGRYLIIENGTSNVSNDLYVLDMTTNEFEKLNEDEGNAEYLSMTMMPDNETIWLRSNANEDGMMRVGKMTVGSSEIEYLDDGWLDDRWEVKRMYVSSDYKILAAITNEDGYQRLSLREIISGKNLPTPELEGSIDNVSIDANGNVLMTFESSTKAPDVWRWNPYDRDLKQLTFSHYAGIDRSMFSEPKLVRYTSFDGLEIPAFLYLPPDYEEGKPIPFVVYAHGGPESQFQPKFSRTFQFLPLNGFGVFAPNPRGSSGYGREYRDMDNYKNRKKSLQDYKAGVDWLVEEGYTTPEMLGIRGGSYGGYVVLGMITEYPELFSAAVDVVGIASFKTFLLNTKPYRRKYRETEYGPLSDSTYLDSISPLTKAHLIQTPLLVIHGANDPRVPVTEAYQIVDAIESRGGVVDSLIFHDEGHASWKRDNIIASYRKQLEFLNRHIKVLESDIGQE